MEKQYKIYDELAVMKVATTSVPCKREFAKLCPAGSLLNLTVVRKDLAVFGSFFSSLKFLLAKFSTERNPSSDRRFFRTLLRLSAVTQQRVTATRNIANAMPPFFLLPAILLLIISQVIRFS